MAKSFLTITPITNNAAKLDQLMLFCGIEKRSDLLEEGLSLFRTAVTSARSGQTIASYNPVTNTVEIPHLPALDAAARLAGSTTTVDLIQTSTIDPTA